MPDGSRADDNGHGTATILVNHEIGGTEGVLRANSAIGSFVSKLIVNTTTLAVTSMTDQATQVLVRNSATSSCTLTTTGGTGSNFLLGGAGSAIFYVDGRGAAPTWSTIVDWTAGEQLVVWDWKPGTSKNFWAASDGTAGFRGTTMHADLEK